MRYTIDTERKTLSIEVEGKMETLDLYSKKAFELLSDRWIQLGWNQKYPYTFTWCGRPIIQLPEDLLRMQEVIYKLKPDVIIETGVAHGGSLIFYASLCKVIGKGRVIGIDIDIRKKNREAIEQHPLYPLITLIEGSSTDAKIVNQIKEMILAGENVMVILDSNHSKQHVWEELNAYSSLVTPGFYIVATDGVMKDLTDVPRGNPSWLWDNPAAAAIEFAQKHPEFKLANPEWLFNESELTESVTHWPSAWLRRK